MTTFIWLLIAGCHPEAPSALPPVVVRARDDGSWQGRVGLCDGSRQRDPDAPLLLLPEEGPWGEQDHSPEQRLAFDGSGTAIADFDGDGRLDLLIGHHSDPLALWLQSPDGTFVPAHDRLPARPIGVSSIVAVDIDADGLLDAHVTVFKDHDLALLNDGTGHFVDVADDIGLRGPRDEFTLIASWADADSDGDLDVFVGVHTDHPWPGSPTGPSRMMLQHEGRFYDVAPNWAPPETSWQQAFTFFGGWTDVDLDGDQDLIVINDFGHEWPTELWRQDRGRLFLDGDSGLGFADCNMGLGLGDINGDEIPDALIVAWDDVALFESHPSGTWFDTSTSRGIRLDASRGQQIGWSGELVDVDNDGDLDAHIVTGYLKTSSPDPIYDQPDALFLQDDDGLFHDVAPQWGIDDPGRGRGAAWADLNHDGWPDLLLRDQQGPTKIWHQTCGDASWLGISLRQSGPNPFAIGARVRVLAEDRVWSREIRAGGTGYAIGGPPEALIGTGDTDVVDVEVRWPDGHVDRLEAVETRQYLEVVRADDTRPKGRGRR